MLYYNNQELAAANHVSVRTVRNWIEAAKAGKLDLSLHTKGERTFIANTSKNSLAIKDLVEKGKKFRPHRAQRTVVPKPEFYELFTQEQLYDIVSNLEINHEIPRQYNYFGKGADNWDNYIKRLELEESTNSLISTVDLLAKNRAYLDGLTESSEQINVIDIGAGNAFPVKQLLENLIRSEKLGRYIALDISPTMLDIAQKNIEDWFGDKIVFERHLIDIEHDRFGNLLADEYIKPDANSTTNLFLFFGGTISNFKQPSAILKNIHDSMGVNDLFLHSQRLDTQNTRRYFDFNPGASSTFSLAPNHRYIFDLLNVDESIYDAEMGFDTDKNERFIRVTLKFTLAIRFKFTGGERIVHFEKGDTILLWRARHTTLINVADQLIKSDIQPLQLSQSNNGDYILTISRIKHD